MILNAAARLVVGAGKFERPSAAVRHVLHWLPVPRRVQFKAASLAFDCVTGPAYIKDVCTPVLEIAARSNLRLYAATCLCHERLSLVDGGRHVAAPAVWNTLPAYFCSTSRIVMS